MSQLCDAAIFVLCAVEFAGTDGIDSSQLIELQRRRGDDRTKSAIQAMAHNLAAQGYLARLPRKEGDRVTRWVRTSKPVPVLTASPQAAGTAEHVRLVEGRVRVPPGVARSVFEWRGQVQMEPTP